MKKFGFLLAIAGMAFVACSSQPGNVVKLKKGTPAYELATAVAKKVPYFDPNANNILVTSNDFKISTGAVIQEIQNNFGAQAGQLGNMDSAQIVNIVMQNAEGLGEKKLLLSAAESANIMVTDQAVDSVLQLQYAHVGGKDQFMSRIKNAGFDSATVAHQIRQSLMVNKYFDKTLADQVQVSESEIEDAYHQDKTATVRHILLSTQGKSDSAKQAIHKKMEDILQRARNGEDFAKLAKEYSEDPGSKDKGGLYEDVPRGQMVKPFEDAMFSVPVGQISDIVETRFGYHIIKVINRNSETKPLSAVHDSIAQKLEQQKRNDAYTNQIQKLKDEANFKVKELQ